MNSPQDNGSLKSKFELSHSEREVESSSTTPDSASINYEAIRPLTSNRRGSNASKHSFNNQLWSRESQMVFADIHGADLRRESSMPGWDDDVDEEDQQQPSTGHSSVEDLEAQRKADMYHIFTYPQKRLMVYIVSLAGLFSPLSSNIYFPALREIADDVHVSMDLATLTVTIYMIVQGIAPSFWGPLSDTKGRRIVFIATFAVYLISNACLALSNNYIALMICRALQAAGSAATISIGAGVIGDITTAQERGGLIGIFGGIRMLGQSIGPVFGGLISQYLGYHAIFWFLLGLGSLSIFLIICFLPETLRSIAGNGSVPLYGIHRPLYYKKPFPNVKGIKKPATAPLTLAAIFSPLRFLFEKDVFCTLFFGSIVYTVWSMVTSSTTDVFSDKYGLDTLEIGLAFLPNGAGCVAGSYLTGTLMDWDFKRTERAYRQAKGIPEGASLSKKELAATDFPVEFARQRNIWWIVFIFIGSVAGYGFSLRMSNPALPLVLQFFIAYSATAVFSLNSALVIDLYPGASASATAVNNLVRCSVGAAGVAVVQPMLNAMGDRWTFFTLAGVTMAAAPLLVLVSMYGMKWRLERVERLRKPAGEQAAQTAHEQAGGEGEKRT